MIALVVIAVVRLADKSNTIYAYRVIDDRAIAVQVTSGPGTWTRVTSVAQSDSSVTVGVSTIGLPLAGFGDDVTWLAVNLVDPIAARSVVDESTGTHIPLSKAP